MKPKSLSNNKKYQIYKTLTNQENNFIYPFFIVVWSIFFFICMLIALLFVKIFIP